MSNLIPFVPSRNNYRIGVPIDSKLYLFDNIKWNTVDESWSFDLREADETPILMNIKVTLGIALGGKSTHPFFAVNSLKAIDTSGANRDPGFADLGDRVQVKLTTPTNFGT